MSRLVLALAARCLPAACRDSGSTAPTAPTARPATVALSATASGALPSFVVHLTGTPGLAFSGWCEGATAQGGAPTQGGATTQRVAGTVPPHVVVAGTSLGCTVQNPSGTGTLRVPVVRDTGLVSTSETTGGGEIVVRLPLPEPRRAGAATRRRGTAPGRWAAPCVTCRYDDLVPHLPGGTSGGR